MNTQPSRLRASTRGLVALVLLLSALLPVAATAAPVASPCAPGAVYDQACDVDHDGDVDVMDIQLAAGHFNQSGTFNPSDNNHNHLGQTWTGLDNPLVMEGSFSTTGENAPLILSNTDGPGLRIDTAGSNGIRIGSVNNDALRVIAAGDDGVQVDEAGTNGIKVQLAWGDGVNVSSAGNYGVRISSAGIAGVSVHSAGDGYYVDHTGSASSYGGNAGNNGVEIGNAEDVGVYVNSAGDDGVFVCATGSASGCTPNGYSNGVEIGNAEDYGVWVNSAGYSGVFVDSAGANGVYVGSAGDSGVWVNSAGEDGVTVYSAGNPSNHICSSADNGFEVCGADGEGLYVGYAGGNGVNVAGENLAGYFGGTIQVTGFGGCNGCLLTTFGVNISNTSLAPGDVVSLSGLQASGVDSVPMLIEVTSANDGAAVVGVVQGWAELVTEDEPRSGEIGKRLVPREGAAEPGQYVTIAYSGLTQVKATGLIAQGSKLAVGADGAARSLRTVTVEGVQLAENAAVIGTALESLDGEGLVWVLVNVQ